MNLTKEQIINNMIESIEKNHIMYDDKNNKYINVKDLENKYAIIHKFEQLIQTEYIIVCQTKIPLFYSKVLSINNSNNYYIVNKDLFDYKYGFSGDNLLKHTTNKFFHNMFVNI